MDKLTWYDEDGQLYCRRGYEVALARLASYEATGLMPESVEALKLSMMGKAISGIKEFNGLPIDRLKELTEADKEGRVVVLPCKVGDTVYTLNCILDNDNAVHDRICARKIKGYSGNVMDKVWLIANGKSYDFCISPSELGKTVFLTREEAEKALEAMKKE